MSKGRRREDFKGGNPDVGKATQIKPGEVRNPSGRPKRLPFTDRYREILERPLTADLLRSLGINARSRKAKFLLAQNITVGDAMVLNLTRIGLVETKFAGLAMKEMREPIEGKAIQRIGGPDGESLVPPKLTVNFVKGKGK